VTEVAERAGEVTPLPRGMAPTELLERCSNQGDHGSRRSGPGLEAERPAAGPRLPELVGPGPRRPDRAPAARHHEQCSAPGPALGIGCGGDRLGSKQACATETGREYCRVIKQRARVEDLEHFGVRRADGRNHVGGSACNRWESWPRRPPWRAWRRRQCRLATSARSSSGSPSGYCPSRTRTAKYSSMTITDRPAGSVFGAAEQWVSSGDGV
jgi:hypothetical protein